jgi:bifunctional DNA-binding transcriptional regulator/antitoxin component of YhaV-PrlF toxin-antitoxin module
MAKSDPNPARRLFTTLEDDGQVMIPLELLEALGIESSAPYQLSVDDDRIDIKFLDQ